MKICTQCAAEKPLAEFNWNGPRRHAQCKHCLAIKRKEYCKNNALKQAAYFRRYQEANAEKLDTYQREYYLQNRERIIARASEYVARNPEKTRAYQRKWKEENTDKLKEYAQQYAEENRQRLRQYHAKYARQYRKGYLQRRPIQRIAGALRIRINKLVKQHVKSARTSQLLGCTTAQLRLHLEAQFKAGMNWDNFGFGHDRWNVDHVIPCASFDLSKESEQRRCCHYSNLQPMWQIENFKKGSRY